VSITLKFCGATRTVTGSCFMLETEHVRILVDCGLFLGLKTLKALNYSSFPFRPADIDAVLLTHAHIDHSGLLPKLVREGFTGRIFATRGTIDLCSYLLPDAGSIQESEVRLLNSRNTRRGRPEVAPIYTAADAIETLNAFRPVDYETWISVGPGIRARCWNAGHFARIGFNRDRMCEQGGSRPRRSSRSIGTMRCRSSFSTSTPASTPLLMSARAASSFVGCDGRSTMNRVPLNAIETREQGAATGRRRNSSGRPD
jgi:hypothetical protein